MDLPKQLDLGVGGANRIKDGYQGYGVDIVATERPWLLDNKSADLAIDSIPYEDDMFDYITAYDFLEHIPPVMYYLEDWNKKNVKRNCMIELFNEIYRVLKDGGQFYHQTPGYYPDWNLQSVWSDPTHCFVWTPDTANHFSGDYTGQHDDYGHKSKFKLISSTFDNNGHFIETYQAIKPNMPPYEVAS